MSELVTSGSLLSGGRKNVFRINDIDLVVPPTNISVQKEDLIYEWRALRANSTTKIPSGQGQAAISVSIPFTASQVLDMHRLVVEFIHSPFCSIENRLLRETIVPHWPIGQNMAFTMTGLSLTPMQGSSDTWICNLDLTWFNYFPYVHNWLYRKDWVSLPISSSGPLDSRSDGRELTIGWGWDGENKVPRYVVLPKSSTGVDSIRPWDLVQDSYTGQTLSIQDMEQLHRGEIFDLLPFPNRMAPSKFVDSASDSRIYTRYINYLQRDSLLKNFGVDVELDLGWPENPTALHSALFGAVADGETHLTYGLHSGPPVDSGLYREWRSLSRSWSTTMNSFHGGAKFAFANYKELRMPQRIADAVSKAHTRSIENAREAMGLSASAGSAWVDQELLLGTEITPRITGRVLVRKQFTNEKGKYAPLGHLGSQTSMPVTELFVTDYVKWRGPDSSAVRDNGSNPRMHWGTDYRAPVGSPVFSVDSGHVSRVQLTTSSGNNSWRRAGFDGSGKLDMSPVSTSAGYLDDFRKSLSRYDPAVEFDGPNIKVGTNTKFFGAGLVIQSATYSQRYYVMVPRNTAGNYVNVEHTDGSISRYLHLDSAVVAKDDTVAAGQLLGYSGRTGQLATGLIDAGLYDAIHYPTQSSSFQLIDDNSDTFVPEGAGQSRSVWQFPPHLHFEFWEPRDISGADDPSYDFDDGVPEVRSPSRPNYVPVDPRASYAAASAGSLTIDFNGQSTAPKREDVRRELTDELGAEEADGLVGTMGALWADGWLYYDKDTAIRNLWYKPFVLAFELSNSERLEQDAFVREGAVLTAVAGGLRHVVANIPILGHEYPTQQHLGSVEPFYSFEFCSVDGEGSAGQELAGLSEQAQLLMGMRTLLHANSRKFRQISDSWACAGDSFITRILGSYNEGDVRVQPGQEFAGEFLVEDVDLKRRLVNTRGSSSTMQGHPGFTCHTLEFSQTNPYIGEEIKSTAPELVEVEEARKQVLSAISNWEIDQKYSEALTAVLIAQLSGAQTSAPGESDFGQFEIKNLGLIGQTEGTFAYTQDDQEYIIIGSDNEPLGSLLNSLDDDRSWMLPGHDNVFAIPLEEFSSYLVSSESKELAESAQKSAQSSPDGIRFEATYVVKTTYKYDISSAISSSQELLQAANVPVAKLLDYKAIVDAVLKTAEMYLIESPEEISSGFLPSGGKSNSVVKSELYDLDVKPSLYRYFQRHIERWIEQGKNNMLRGGLNAFDNNDPINDLRDNRNWLSWDEPLDSSADDDLQVGLASAAEVGVSAGISLVTYDFTLAIDALLSGGKDLVDLLSGSSTSDFKDGVFAATLTNFYETSYSYIANTYLNLLPLKTVAVDDRLKGYLTNNAFGDILGTLTNGSKSPVFGNVSNDLVKVVASCGRFSPTALGGLPAFVAGSPARRGGRTSEGPSGEHAPADAKFPVFDAGGGVTLKNLSLLIAGGAEGIFPFASPFQWPVSAALEDQKLSSFKKILAGLADELRSDFDILRTFGLEHLALSGTQARLRGSQALPDMDLPFHPYYGNVAACPPDFYMWNMYDDGDAHNTQMIEDVEDAMDQIVQNCYDSIKKKEKGEKYTPSKNKIILDPGYSEEMSLNVNYSAEGTDGGGAFDFGPTGFPFYPHPDSSTSIGNWISNTNTSVEDSKNAAAVAQQQGLVVAASAATGVVVGAVAGSASGTAASSAVAGSLGGNPAVTRSQVDNIVDTKAFAIRMSLFEGAFGQGSGVQYPARLGEGGYETLKNQIDSITSMFGSRAGYLNQKELPDDTSSRTANTVLERSTDPTHEFNADAIKLLAKQSAADIFSQKRTMRRAYPTFKLFFVEEDQFESRLLNFDDFNSYNGVTSFSVVQSRKSPSDTAVIKLLNVGGTLDGTRRDAVVDLDYFGRKDVTKVPGQSSKGGDPITAGSALDQPFGAIVLRPGLNVQLRAGYSNDPNQLTVLISGRVVDVQWNSGGDRAEIMVQSFGTELQQAIKGTHFSEDDRSFASTHQLLGQLMLEPELQHFGRWSFGKIYQAGEGSDSRLDFNDYASEGFLGSFGASSGLIDWVSSSPILMIGAGIIGVTALSRIPGLGRIFRWAATKSGSGGWVHKLLGKLGIVGSSLGTRGWQRVILKKITSSRGGTASISSRLSRAEVAAAFREGAAQRSLLYRALNKVASKNASAAKIGRAGRDIHPKALKDIFNKIDDPNVEDVANILAKADADLFTLLFKGRWMKDPLVEFGLRSDVLMGIGLKSVKNILSGSITGPASIIAGAAGTGLLVDLLSAAGEEVLGPVWEENVNRIKAYFRSRQVSIFLSPQDDNLFPPHPKDYMDMSRGGIISGMQDWAIKAASSIFFSSGETGTEIARWFSGNDPFDKRVTPELYEYKIISSTIWDIFHEMSLRHPGWVYGTRPYGTEFRYTMFFGVPSQRYWSRGADAQFITRANDLARFLESEEGDPVITIEEWRLLYGDQFSDDLSLDELSYQIQSQTAVMIARGEGASGLTDGEPFDSSGAQIRSALSDSPGARIRSAIAAADAEEINRVLTNHVLQNKAMAEYLRALELRFVPFRRYHSISSDHDLVWNGLISSENAVYNAVDVPYFATDGDEETPVGSALFKAHAFIPEYSLRVLPLEPTYNCRGYQMAMRYGVGSLLHTMREMYRGEIITLGNPRVRPWDIGILSDSYNEMVGPIEVEQVVHTMSHETGYITEIKPGAVVLANEISSWPVLEAMKTAVLAVKDVDDTFVGLKVEDGGVPVRALDWALGTGVGGSLEYISKLAERAEDLRPFNPLTTTGGEDDFAKVHDAFEDLRSGVLGVGGVVAIGAAAAVAGIVYKGLPHVGKVMKAVGHSSPAVGKALSSKFVRAGAAVAGGVGVAGVGGVALGFVDSMTPSSLVWLLGGPILFLSCLRGDSIMLVPLMKNGHPIVSGLNLSDPSMIWNNFKGDLGNWADDALGGTKDLARLWSTYGEHAWRKHNTLSAAGQTGIDSDNIARANLTGEDR